MGNVFCACVGNGDDSNRPRRLVRTVRSDDSGVGEEKVLVDVGAVGKHMIQGEPVVQAGASDSSSKRSAVETHKSASPWPVWQKYIETGEEPSDYGPERSAFARLKMIKEQKKEVESLPVREVYGLRSRHLASGSTGYNTGYTIRLQTGLSSDVEQVHDVIIDPEVLRKRNFSIPEHAALYNSNTVQSLSINTHQQQRLLVKDLKEEIARQICGNTKVFEIWYYVEKEETELHEEEEEADDGSDVGGEFVMLKDMEQLMVSVVDDGGDEHGDGALRSSERRPSRNHNFANQLRIFFYGQFQEWKTFRDDVPINKFSIPRYVMEFSRDECQIFVYGVEILVDDPLVLFEFRKCEKIFTGQCTGSSWSEDGNPQGRPTSMLVKLNSSSELFHGDLERIQKVNNKGKLGVYPLSVDEVQRLLLETNKRIYIFVGREIFAFSLPDDEIGEIEWLYSTVRHRGVVVPYTVAVGKKYLYFLEHQIIHAAPRAAIQEETWLYEDVYEGDESRFEDAYSWFYGHDRVYLDEDDIPMNRWRNNTVPMILFAR